MFVPCASLRAETIAALCAQVTDVHFDVWFAFDNPHGQWTQAAYKNVQLNYEKARQVALRDGYAALWCVENDMIVPPDALAKLWGTDAPVVSGLYVLRHGANAANLRWNDRAIEWADLRRLWQNGVREMATHGGCQGCVLIRREALADFCFERAHNAAPDIDFMRHCTANGIRQVGRLDVMCGHVDADGTVLKAEDFVC